MDVNPMLPLPATSRMIRFGTFEVDPQSRELFRQGLKVKIQEQPLHVLLMLLERPGKMITREELRQALWPGDTFVDFDQSLNKDINKIREALGDTAENPRYVETLPRRGYRFIAPVETPRCADSEEETSVSLAVNGAVAPVYDRRTETAAHRAALQKRIALAVGIVAGALTVLIALNVAGLRNRLMLRVAPPRAIESLAVLPLVNLSGDSEQEYFSDGMTEELITDLAKVRSLRVISRTSVMQYKGAKKPLTQIAGELNVDALIEGAVLRSGNRIRITAQLIQAKPEKHLWANSYERDLSDVLALQGEVARTISQQVEANLTPQEQKRMSTVRSINPQALEHYLRGRYAVQKMTEKDLKEALAQFQKATELDPAYAQAYAGSAAAYYWLSNMWMPSREALPKSKAAALKALELDENLGEAHASLALVLSQYEWDWQGAGNAYRRAIELSPSSAFARTSYGIYLAAMGNFGESLAELNKALELDPFSEGTRTTVVWPLYYGRRFNEEIPRVQKILQADPDNAWGHMHLGQAYEGTGRCDQALEEFGKALQLANNPHVRAVMIGCLRKLKRYDEARKRFAELKEQEKKTYVSPITWAVAYANLEDREGALEALERAYRERCEDLAWLRNEPEFDHLHSDPRFQDLLRRMNFPP